MNPIEAEALAAVHGAEHWAGSLFRRHPETTAAPAAATIPTIPTGGTTMTTPASPFDGVRHFIDDAEKMGIETFGRVQRIAANPYTLPALVWLDTLSGGHIPADVLTKTLGAIEGLHLAYPKPEPDGNGQQTAQAQQ